MTSLIQASDRKVSVVIIEELIYHLRGDLKEANFYGWRASERAKTIKLAMHFIVAEMRKIRYTSETFRAFFDAWTQVSKAYKDAKDVLMWKCKKSSERMAFSAKLAMASLESWIESGVS
jgi:hypothetical protein